MVKQSAKRLLRATLLRSPLPELRLRHSARQSLTILAYHRIGELPDTHYPFDDALFSASEEEFARELRYCRRNLDMLSLPELLRGLEAAQHRDSSAALPARPALLTFDDGYADNLTHAVPLLREAGLTACFFLCSHIVGTSVVPWWDQIACCFKFSRTPCIRSPFAGEDAPYLCDTANRARHQQRFLDRFKATPWTSAMQCLDDLRTQTGVIPEDYATRPLFLSWQQAAELVSQGMDVGGHTRTHPILSQVAEPELLEAEIGGGAADIKRALGCAPLAFAYPVGGEAMMSAAADAAIARAGFRISFSYQHGVAPRQPNALWRLPRFHAEHGNDFGGFRFELARAPRRAQSPCS